MAEGRAGLATKLATGVIAAAIIVVLLIWVPKIEVFGWRSAWTHPLAASSNRHGDFQDEDRARQTLATILGGMAVLGGAFLTFRNVRAAERNADIARDNAETARKVAEQNAETAQKNLDIARKVMEQNAETAQKNLKIAGDKQLTDRFTVAVNNLAADGADKMAVRLGGIYALERIARDSPEDHWTVMEVLTAYIRDNRRRQEDLTPQGAEARDGETGPEKNVLPTDIQAILTVIGRRNAEHDQDKRLNLRAVDLTNADLWEANLWRARLGGANLGIANLGIANLWGADLVGAFLMEARLGGADLRGAILRGARLGGAHLVDCLNLTQEQLDSADQRYVPEALPPGLIFNGLPAPSPPAAPPQTA